MGRLSRLFALILGAAVVGGACDSNSSPTGPATHPLAGTWYGTITEQVNSLHCSMVPTENPVYITAEFSVENDSTVRAVVRRVEGPSCEAVGTLNGSRFSLIFEPCTELFTAKVTCFFDWWVGGKTGDVSGIEWTGTWAPESFETVGWARSSEGGAAGLKIKVHR